MGEKKSFFDSSMCKSKKNCEKCRLSKDYREGISKVFDVPEVDFDCPLGKVAEEYKNIEIPSVFGMAKNLLETAKEVAKHKKRTGRTLAPTKVQEERMAICNACNYYVKNRCKKCGCNLSAKVTLAGAKCPLKKWLQFK
jgi:hypothetical protein